MDIINPANEQIIATVESDDTSAVLRKFELVKKGQENWAAFDLSDRIDCLRKFSDLLKTNLDRLAGILTSETGKPLIQASGEILGARKRIAYFLENSEKWLKEEIVFQDDSIEEKISYEPLGIIANISAWNYPYLVGVNVFVPALIAGNTVLYKPSEYATLTGIEIEKLLYSAGIPENVFQAVIGKGEAGQALLDLGLDGYFFTGSHKTGKHIYETVAPKMVPCQLELGGKDPLYVTEDNKNISDVAKAVAEGAFYNNGQSCCSVERIYVHSEVYGQFIEKFVEEVKGYDIGNPETKGVFIGPLTRKEQLSYLSEQVKDALNKGAETLVGGNKIEGTGYYFEPTVLTEVNHEMSIMKDESFGPVIGIQKVESDEEAITLMKDTEYGLTSSIYTSSLERAEEIMREMNSGTVYWNCCDRVSATLPWSGRKHSGIGSTLSHLGIRAFVQPKAHHLKKN